MRPFPLLLALFLLVPIAEVYLFIAVGDVIGKIPTVALVVFTAVLGALLMRAQGFATFRRMQASLARGELPAMELLEGVVILVGGALLLTPGFLTDAFGFLCLITPTRRALVRAVMRRAVLVSGQPTPQRESRQGPVTLEGEYRKDDEL